MNMTEQEPRRENQSRKRVDPTSPIVDRLVPKFSEIFPFNCLIGKVVCDSIRELAAIQKEKLKLQRDLSADLNAPETRETINRARRRTRSSKRAFITWR